MDFFFDLGLTMGLIFCRLDLMHKNSWVECDADHIVSTCGLMGVVIRLRYQHNLGGRHDIQKFDGADLSGM